jgi:hypothetical protein
MKEPRRTSAQFSPVRTFARSTTLVMHNCPSRNASATAGNCWTSLAATAR